MKNIKNRINGKSSDFEPVGDDIINTLKCDESLSKVWYLRNILGEVTVRHLYSEIRICMEDNYLYNIP